MRVEELAEPMVTRSGASKPDVLVRAVSHGLANRLLGIRCNAELAAACARRGEDPTEELDLLLAATRELTILERGVADATLAALSSGPAGLELLTARIGQLFPAEAAHHEEFGTS